MASRDNLQEDGIDANPSVNPVIVKASPVLSDSDQLDLSDEKGSEHLPSIDTIPYDPRPHEDAARRKIAYLLIGLLWVVVLLILEMTAFSVIKVDEIKDFSVILGPLVTLVSAATGFYYGTKSK